MKSLLVIAIVLAIVSMATPYWQVIKIPIIGEQHVGLFQSCQTSKTKSKLCVSVDKDYLKSCQGLAISAVVFLTVGLACDFIPLNEFKQCRLIGAGSYLIGLILMIACISLFAAKKSTLTVNGSVKSELGYSFYLMLGSLALVVVAGVAGVINRRKK